MENQIKPCPFCGKEAVLEKLNEVYVIGCDTEMCYGNINHMTMVFYSKENAIKTWNRRECNG